ncbi:ABC transporter permease [Streptomyces physcomitrii]|nr:FtsX-like permease family protein [Streptomyces physcomitrii]
MSAAPASAPPAAPPGPTGPDARQGWLRDLAMGARFAVTGGRESWVRTLLTGVGVGIGVTLLLLTTAIPNALAERSTRTDARNDYIAAKTEGPAPNTLLLASTDTTFRHQDVRGRLVEPEGPKAPLPPGVRAFPVPGEMLVSPALKELLDSGGSERLRERLPYRIGGTIGDEGLAGPHELAYYAGATGLEDRLGNGPVQRLDRFGTEEQEPEELGPALTLLILIIFVVLLMPVGVFIAAAVRFGGERRDRRLAALRLMGADGRTTRLIASGEAVAGAVLGLVLGTVFFLIARQLASQITLFDLSFFPQDLTPHPALAALVVLAVPGAAIAVTLLALRGVVIEPLGVVRTAKPPRRRLWWRLLLPVAGLALLLPMSGEAGGDGDFNEWVVVTGTVLLLVGVTALLPWLVEALVLRLGGGALSWQLAVRRLQLSSGTAARMVNGIAVAVAGAIALQMMFTSLEGDYVQDSGQDTTRAQVRIDVDNSASARELERALRAGGGVADSLAFDTATIAAKPREPDTATDISVGSCAALRQLAELPSCHEGDAFLLPGGDYSEDTAEVARPGRTVYLSPSYEGSPGAEAAWRLPARLPTAKGLKDPLGMETSGVLVTPSAFSESARKGLTAQVYVRLDKSTPDAVDRVRTSAARVDPLANELTLVSENEDRQFAAIRTGLLVGASCVLMLIGASLLISQLEQLRERRKLLSSLVAFGTRRRTLSLSVLWQTALPVALGVVLASAVGITLGAVLLKMVSAPVRVDWTGVASMAGIATAVVLAVTALSMPALLRLMRPEGLRTE